MTQKGTVVADTQDQGDLPPWSTTAEVATRFKTVEGTVRFWRKKGYGPRGVRVGQRVLYARDEILRFERELSAQVAEAA